MGTVGKRLQKNSTATGANTSQSGKKPQGVWRKTVKKGLMETLQTTSKQLIWIFSINGILWIWCSYALAFMQRDQIAEALSTNVCTVIIGQMGMYLVSKTVENVFKYNNFKHTGVSDPHQLNEEGIYLEEPSEEQFPGDPGSNGDSNCGYINPEDFA